jgi:hypothetical protein
VDYLGHIIDKDGVRVDPKKFEAMQNYPRLKKYQELAWFIDFNRILSKICLELWKKCSSSNCFP